MQMSLLCLTMEVIIWISFFHAEIHQDYVQGKIELMHVFDKLNVYAICGLLSSLANNCML